MSASTFEHEWLAWYINTTKDSSADTQRLKDIPLDFNASADCLQGFVNLSSSSSQTYFTWNYLPSIISGLFAILWGLVDSEVKRIEPFYQASRPNGASARSVLFSEYITFPSFLSIFQAVWWLQWTPFLSALCMVLMAVISPVLQAFIFQSRGQLLEIGVLSDATGLSAGEKFQPFGADYLISDYFSNARNVTGIHLVGRCITDEALVDNYYSNFTIYQRSSVYAYMYVDYTVGIAQGIIYLVVSLLGGILLFRLRSRRSGMKASYGDVATLSALATADPSFMECLSYVMDLTPERARIWKAYIRQQRVHLGPVPDGSRDSGSHASRRHYGFYFDRPIGQSPLVSHREGVKNPTERFSLFLIMGYTFGMYAPNLVISGVSYNPFAGPPSPENKGSWNGPTTPTGPIPALILLALGKALWKTIENHFLAFAFLGYWQTETQKNRHCRDFIIPFSPSVTVLGREYSRMPPVWLTLRAIADADLALVAVSIISLCWEIAVMAGGIFTSMSVSSGLGKTEYRATYGITMGSLVASLVTYGLAARSIKQRLKPTVGATSVGGLASVLSLMASDGDLLGRLRGLRLVDGERERIRFLREELGEARYGFRRQRAVHLSGGYTYGIGLDSSSRRG